MATKIKTYPFMAYYASHRTFDIEAESLEEAMKLAQNEAKRKMPYNIEWDGLVEINGEPK
jgi:hypothetical protein